MRAKKSRLHEALKKLHGEEGNKNSSAVQPQSSSNGNKAGGGDANNMSGDDVLGLVEGINATVLAAHPRKALLKENSYKILGISTRKVDLAALVVLPGAFVAFNIYYWTIMNV